MGDDFAGFAATGARVELEGIDELTVRDGLIQENNAFSDSMAFARQIGVLPPEARARTAACWPSTRRPRRPAARWPGPAAGRRRGLDRPRGLPDDDERLPRARRRRRPGLRRRDQAMAAGIAAAAARWAGSRAWCSVTAIRTTAVPPPASGAGVLPRRRRPVRAGRRRLLELRLLPAQAAGPPALAPPAQGLGRRAGATSPEPWSRATTSRASRSCTCPATRPGSSGSTARPTGWP